MITLARQSFLRSIFLLIASSGFATLSWELIWQIKSSLVLGISAWGAALTLAVMMGGLSLGSFLMRSISQKLSLIPAVRVYGALEIMIGIFGLMLGIAFELLARIDTWAYSVMPASLSLVYILGMSAIFGLPALCMGATFPVFGLISKHLQVPMTKLYALNTIGAAASILFVAFILIPLFGISHSIGMIAVINISIGISTWLLVPADSMLHTTQHDNETEIDQSRLYHEMFIVFVTGFAIFSLEVAWFRSFANYFPNTTDVFAIILACALLSIGMAARKVPTLKQQKKLLGSQLCMAGLLIFIITPIIERLDMGFAMGKQLQSMLVNTGVINSNSFADNSLGWLIDSYTFDTTGMAAFYYTCQFVMRFLFIFILIVPPIRYIGTAFPWILDNQRSPRKIGKLYAINTLAAVIGSIAAAWLLLPAIGFAKTAWVAGILVTITGLTLLSGLKRFGWVVLGIAGLSVAIHFNSGIGQTRVQGFFATDGEGRPSKVLASFEEPQATISAIEYKDKSRALLINSTAAAWESGLSDRPSIHYMAAMGYLPMLLHPDPKNALVICFGTGQTANAVRRENPQLLEIVDVSSSVFTLAKYFRSNEQVLNDPKVKTTVMDGRAYLRRTSKIYDVITLEPMPPNTVGVNALYSREFYRLAQKHLGSNGVIAQWLPFHLMSPRFTASIARTFIEVFPNAILWLDQRSKTGILIGTNDRHINFKETWPGFIRKHPMRDLTSIDIQQGIVLTSADLQAYGKYGEVITDDNQLLAYGKSLYVTGLLLNENFALLRRINKDIPAPYLDSNFK